MGTSPKQPARAKARTGVSGTPLYDKPETPPLATLGWSYSGLRYGSVGHAVYARRFPSPIKMSGNEKLLPNNLPDYYNIFTDESLPVKAVDDPMGLNIEEIHESLPVALLMPR